VENYHGLHLHVDMFRAHLEHLRSHFTVVPLQTLIDHYLRGQALPPNPAVVTMDDGYRSNYALAYPLLRQFQIPATIFLTTDFVDGKRYQWTDRVEYAVGHAAPQRLSALLGEAAPAGDSRDYRGRALTQLKQGLKQIPQERRAAQVDAIEERLGCSLRAATDVPAIYQPLDWPEVLEMRGDGLVSFGNHTVSHFILARCTPDVVRHQVQAAKHIIEERVGLPCPLFCYPNGGPGDFDERTNAIVREAGHVCALTTVAGLNGSRSDVFRLKRIGILNGQTREDFMMAGTGITPLSLRSGFRSSRNEELY
jgi:peptidoglycan/xylan/chitin deacetylase (PgdA/CDA1 family)